MREYVDFKSCFFRMLIEDVFEIPKRRIIVAAGRVEKGVIHDRSTVVIAGPDGEKLSWAEVLDLDWFDRHRCSAHVSADKGRNIAVLFDCRCREALRKGNSLVIESDEE